MKGWSKRKKVGVSVGALAGFAFSMMCYPVADGFFVLLMAFFAGLLVVAVTYPSSAIDQEVLTSKTVPTSETAPFGVLSLTRVAREEPKKGNKHSHNTSYQNEGKK